MPTPDAEDLLAGIETEAPFGAFPPRPLDRAVWAAADWRPLPAPWRRRLRKRFARPRAGPFDIVHEGMRMRLYPAENQCDRVVFGRRSWPEPEEHKALEAHLSPGMVTGMVPGMVYVDVGANVGSYCLHVARHAPGARIVAFEPHPRTRAKLVTNLALNGLGTRDVLPFALGETDGTLDLWSDGGSNIGHTSLLPGATANPARSVAVAVRRLPDVLAERGVNGIDVMKIDIEGYEDRALMPLLSAEPALWPKVLLLETAHAGFWEHDLMAALSRRGYRRDFATKENVILTRKPA